MGTQGLAERGVDQHMTGQKQRKSYGLCLRCSEPWRGLYASFLILRRCGATIYFKEALVREYYGKELINEFEKTCAEKEMLEKT